MLDLERILGLMSDLEIIEWFRVYIWQTHVWIGDTRWRRPIRCLKLQVVLRKRATNYRALLRKMTCKNKASYGSWPPCSIGPFEETLCSFERESWILYRSFSATEPQTIGLFCGKWPIKIRHLMGFCQPVIFGPARTHCWGNIVLENMWDSFEREYRADIYTRCRSFMHAGYRVFI